MGAVGFPLMIMDATAALARLGVRTMPGHKLLEIRRDGILLEDNAGFQIEEPCDAVIVALGVRSVNTLREQLEDMPNVIVAGDAQRGGRKIPDAVHEAFRAGVSAFLTPCVMKELYTGRPASGIKDIFI